MSIWICNRNWYPTLESNGIRAMTINFQLEEGNLIQVRFLLRSSRAYSGQPTQLHFHMWHCFGMLRDFRRFYFLLFPYFFCLLLMEETNQKHVNLWNEMDDKEIYLYRTCTMHTPITLSEIDYFYLLNWKSMLNFSLTLYTLHTVRWMPFWWHNNGKIVEHAT